MGGTSGCRKLLIGEGREGELIRASSASSLYGPGWVTIVHEQLALLVDPNSDYQDDPCL